VTDKATQQPTKSIIHINTTYKSNRSVSFPSSGGICPLKWLSFNSLHRKVNHY